MTPVRRASTHTSSKVHVFISDCGMQQLLPLLLLTCLSDMLDTLRDKAKAAAI